MWVGVVWACILIFVWMQGKIHVGEWCCEVEGSCMVQQVARCGFLLPRNVIKTCMCVCVCVCTNMSICVCRLTFKELDEIVVSEVLRQVANEHLLVVRVVHCCRCWRWWGHGAAWCHVILVASVHHHMSSIHTTIISCWRRRRPASNNTAGAYQQLLTDTTLTQPQHVACHNDTPTSLNGNLITQDL